MSQGRDQIVEYLRRQLIGPIGGSREVIADPPTSRYSLGAIYARELTSEEAVDGEELDERGGGATDVGQEGPPDDPVALSAQWMPASVGLSMLLDGEELTVELQAGAYERITDVEALAEDDQAQVLPSARTAKKAWRRSPLPAGAEQESHTIAPPQKGRMARQPVLSGRAELVSVWRPHHGGHLVTVTLVNAAEPSPASTEEMVERALFQVEMRCLGPIATYPAARLAAADEEDEELALQYLDQRTYAVGHGAAATWPDTEGHHVDRVEVSWIPTHETPSLKPRTSNVEALRLRRLADASEAASLVTGLHALVDDYEAWTAEVVAPLECPPHLEPARERILARIAKAAARVRAGIDLLEKDPMVFEAFRLANRAIHDSMVRGRGIATSRRARDKGSVDDVVAEAADPTWYPFQLAFQLQVLPSMLETGHPHRETVDLLWFPTGGGKTEAYLGLAAMAIFHRRLTGGGAGVTVLTRYTLRLLTTQQFQRAATLIAACELIRRERADLGHEPISLGLWIGGKSTPNHCGKAIERLEELREVDHPVSPFTLDACPWCATRLVPQVRTEDAADYGFEALPKDFVIRCPSADCPFHERIPAQVVDEVLYEQPPDFCVGTVDKFAQLAFNPDAGRLIGVGSTMPPTLVIQDELHLLSGPLGTMVGIYEAAFQRVMDHLGHRPKVVASTATIRRAADQARALFGCDEVSVFPPPGVRQGDSYFARVNLSEPGRLYAGVMSQVHTPSFSVIQTSAALVQAVEVVDLDRQEEESYGTLVAYHNSLRELGKVVTFARDDIPARIEILAQDDDVKRQLPADSVEELTSNVGDGELTRLLTRMALPPSDEEGLRFVACTNMLSVGVDVPRLALMLVNGQPKTTSEYIQATSRVGRGDVPGLVVTHYSPAKPRDRSHYEQFVTYHDSIYRWVEPTSVTPFAVPARNRALHAALVVLVRLVLGLSQDQDASRFRADLEGLSSTVEKFLAHVARVDPAEVDNTRAHIDRLIAEWDERARAAGGRLRFNSRSKNFEDLLVPFGASNRKAWETPNSMRNVDRECLISIRGAS